MDGNPMDPMLNFKATDRIRASVSEGENGGTRMVNFDVSIVVKNRLDNLSFAFDVSAPEDATIQNELTAMGAEERGKQALYIMVMKTYLGTGPIGGGGGGLGKLNMGSALNSVLSSQINSLMGNLKNASVSVGIEDHDLSDTGGKRTDYSFRYSQRLFNNRFQCLLSCLFKDTFDKYQHPRGHTGQTGHIDRNSTVGYRFYLGFPFAHQSDFLARHTNEID